jgi:uncharacterized protein YjbI with pentapeptide repeats
VFSSAALRRRPSPRQAFWPGISLDLTGAALLDFNFAQGSVVQVRFDGATFRGDAVFDEANFEGDAWFDGVTFEGDASFHEATFEGNAWFLEATFNPVTGFRGATFQVDALFKRATFQGDAWFSLDPPMRWSVEDWVIRKRAL